MPSRIQTTRIQLSAARYLNSTLSKGYVNRTPTSPSDPAVVGRMALLASSVFVIVAILLALLMKFLNPAPNKGASELMMTQEGGLYVLFQDALHPVTNVASARLIVNKADKPSIVNAKTLNSYPTGALMGIPAAPNSLSFHKTSKAKWGLCEWHDSRANLSLTRAESLQTTVVAGEGSFEGGSPLGDSKAVLVATENDRDTLWLLFGNRKAEIGKTDYGVQSALGITPDDANEPLIVSAGLLNAIPSAPDLVAPKLSKSGEEATNVPGYKIGDVLTVSGATAVPDYYAVTVNGIQKVPYLVAQLLINSGGTRNTIADPQTLAMFPRSGDISLTAYPTDTPTLTRPDSLCYTWAKDRNAHVATTEIITASKLPVTDSALERKTDLLPTGAGVESAHAFISPPGEGWYVRATGNGERSENMGQIMYIGDNGVRYAIMPDDKGDYAPTITALGFSGVPLDIPDGIVKLLLPGPDLSRTGALYQHVNIFPEAGAKKPDSTDVPVAEAPEDDAATDMAETQTPETPEPSASATPEPSASASATPAPSSTTASASRTSRRSATPSSSVTR